MRTALFCILALITDSLAEAQGGINFANAAGGVNAPISDASGKRILGPSPYVADLFWNSDTNAPMDRFTAVGVDTGFSSLTNNGGGYFFGGIVTLPVAQVPVLAQVRVWDTNYGPTYSQARDRGGEFGFSNIITVTPSIPPGGQTPLTGLQPFQLQRLPHLSACLTTTNTLLLSWATEQTAYVIQQNPDLSPSNWMTVSSMPLTVGQQQQVVVPVPPSGRMFYRLVSQ